MEAQARCPMVSCGAYLMLERVRNTHVPETDWARVQENQAVRGGWQCFGVNSAEGMYNSNAYLISGWKGRGAYPQASSAWALLRLPSSFCLGSHPFSLFVFTYCVESFLEPQNSRGASNNTWREIVKATREKERERERKGDEREGGRDREKEKEKKKKQREGIKKRASVHRTRQMPVFIYITSTWGQFSGFPYFPCSLRARKEKAVCSQQWNLGS